MPRVIHLHAGNLLGGVEQALLAFERMAALAPSLTSRFACAYQGPFAATLREMGARVEPLGIPRLSRPWSVWNSRRKAKALLATGGFDAAVCHSAWAIAVWGPAVLQTRIPLVLWQHDLWNGRRCIERLASRTRPHLVVTNSHTTAATTPLVYPGIEPRVCHLPVAVIEDHLACEARIRIRRDLGADDRTTAILLAARMDKGKGHHALLAAFAQLATLPAALWIAGAAQTPAERRYEQGLRAEANRLGLGERIRWLGWRADLHDVMRAADIYCQPNLYPESFGLVFAEALSVGTPVVTTRAGGAQEIVHADCGRLVEPGDTAGLAAALRELVVDAAVRGALGRSRPGTLRSGATTRPLGANPGDPAQRRVDSRPGQSAASDRRLSAIETPCASRC
jgi:glycosyltransferase involved in cell wall biosynthesis